MASRAATGLVGGAMIMCSALTEGAPVVSFQQQNNGLLCSLGDNTRLKIEICQSNMVRVVHSAVGSIPGPKGLVVVKDSWELPAWSFAEEADRLRVSTPDLDVFVGKADGSLTFVDKKGTTTVKEVPGSRTLKAVTLSNTPAHEATVGFESPADEGIYGFGQFQSERMNQRGATLTLRQYNTQVVTPMFVSTRGYGVLLNTYSEVKLTPPLNLWNKWTPDHALDYYFMWGPDFDRIIASYRALTGAAPMFPKWAYGLFQSRNQYRTQSEVLGIVKKYRDLGIPADVIVQDYFYWGNEGQDPHGSFKFASSRYPDPAAMVNQIHNQNFRFMITVWPSFGDPINKPYMQSKGYLLPFKDYVGTVYDALNEDAGRAFWGLLSNSLWKIGTDAWWLDASEPEPFPSSTNSSWQNSTTALGPAMKYVNVFPLCHTRNISNGQRSATSNKRVYILTRSGYAGQQRYGTAVWSGDITSQFGTFKKQIPAGLNFCAAGLPYWTTDIAGYSGGDPSSSSYQELFVRWFQFGTFCPIFRVHGERPANELWSYGANAQKILVEYDNLRYRLLPYNYSLAGKVFLEGYTPYRALAFDFRTDRQVRDINNQFMFGPAFLVNPVTTQGATSRSLYLPAGSAWYDFYTGTKQEGGTTITAAAPLATMPLFVRAGAIVPMGPELHWTTEKPADPSELRVYRGADGEFTLYEDENDNYNYEKGAYSRIPIRWDNAGGALTIGERQGSFTGMPASRTFNVVWVGPQHGAGRAVVAQPDRKVTYTGQSVRIVADPTLEGNRVTREGAARAIRVSARPHELTIFSGGEGRLHAAVSDLRGRAIAERTWLSEDGTCRVVLPHTAPNCIQLIITDERGGVVTYKSVSLR